LSEEPSPPVAQRYTPLFEAQHASRFERQSLIREYEDKYDCHLIVVSDAIFPESVVFLEELLCEMDGSKDLHVMLNSPGGDGETAVRLVRSAQGRCKRLTVVLPDQAKSAATLFTLGAHSILMGPVSDLGPVDPQFYLDGKGLVAAKDIIAAVDDATKRVQDSPETYPIWASLLADVTAIMVQQARAATARSRDLLREAIASHPDRTTAEVDELVANLTPPLIEEATYHGAVFDAQDAIDCGLPVTKLFPFEEHWKNVWRLWAKYAVMSGARIYEGAKASQVLFRGVAQ